MFQKLQNLIYKIKLLNSRITSKFLGVQVDHVSMKYKRKWVKQ